MPPAAFGLIRLACHERKRKDYLSVLSDAFFCVPFLQIDALCLSLSRHSLEADLRMDTHVCVSHLVVDLGGVHAVRRFGIILLDYEGHDFPPLGTVRNETCDAKTVTAKRATATATATAIRGSVVTPTAVPPATTPPSRRRRFMLVLSGVVPIVVPTAVLLCGFAVCLSPRLAILRSVSPVCLSRSSYASTWPCPLS